MSRMNWKKTHTHIDTIILLVVVFVPFLLANNTAENQKLVVLTKGPKVMFP